MILSLVVGLAQAAVQGLPIGVAEVSAEGRLCVAMAPMSLAPGADITLVMATTPQVAVAAKVQREVASCKELQDAMVPGPYYLGSSANPVLEAGTVWVAFAGRVTTRLDGSGAIVLEMSGTYSQVQVRMCASSEGLHFTAWAGTPLRSRRLWHHYYYLGYDVEPDCDQVEVTS